MLLFTFFLPVISFVQPRRRLSSAPTIFRNGRRAQGMSRLAALRGHRRLGLYMTEHVGRLVVLGRNSASIGSSSAIWLRRSLPVTPFSSRSSVARRIMDLRKLRRRNVPNGITEVSWEESRGRRGPSRQGRRFAKTAKGNRSCLIDHRRPLERPPRGPHAMQNDREFARDRHRCLL